MAFFSQKVLEKLLVFGNLPLISEHLTHPSYRHGGGQETVKWFHPSSGTLGSVLW